MSADTCSDCGNRICVCDYYEPPTAKDAPEALERMHRLLLEPPQFCEYTTEQVRKDFATIRAALTRTPEAPAGLPGLEGIVTDMRLNSRPTIGGTGPFQIELQVVVLAEDAKLGMARDWKRVRVMPVAHLTPTHSGETSEEE